MEDPFAQMDPIERLKLELELEGRYATPAEKEANAASNMSALWDVTPVVGNIRSLQGSMQAGREAGDAWERGDTRGAVLGRIEQALGLAGAVVPGMGPGKGARNKLNTFVTPEGGDKAALRAADMADDGRGQAEIWDDTKRLLSPDGTIRQEIPDANMTLKRPPKEGALGDFLDHPELFERLPGLKRTPVTLASDIDASGKHVFRSSDAGYQISPQGDLKSGLAKLLQYDTAKAQNNAAALPHGRVALREAFGNSIDRVKNADAYSADEKDVQRAFLDSLRRASDTYEAQTAPIPRGQPVPPGHVGHQNKQAVTIRTSNRAQGNVDARVTGWRANATPEEQAGNPYAQIQDYQALPHQMVIPSSSDFLVLPQPGANDDELMEFMQRWKERGAGR